jgi:N-acetylmuramoyl-L-alanine amidase
MTPLLIIDPGHGGIDPGGGNSPSFSEKEMTLKISLYQYQRFQELQVPAAITRTSDTTLESEERAAKVRNSGARYCISNHINAGGGRGSELIYSIHASSALPKTLAHELEAEGMPNRRVFTRTLPNNPRLDYYYMHRETGSTETVIVEYGFADNPIDEQKINADWRDLAEAIVRGFCQHAELEYRPPNHSASPNPTPNPAPTPTPATGSSPDFPEWKREAIEWLYNQGLLTNEEWRNRPDEPLPLWAEAVILRRLYDKLNV